MDTTTYLTVGFLGLGLAASSGLNTFLPLLVLALAARMHLYGVHLNGSFAWLSSNTALGVLGVAAFLEIIGDKVPSVDHFLDVVGTFARPVAGALAAASVFNQSDPALATILGIIIGAPTALSFHTVKAGTRATSSVGTFGLLNPLLSFFEDMVALIMIFVSILAPFFVPVLLLIFGFIGWKLFKFAKTKWRAKTV